MNEKEQTRPIDAPSVTDAADEAKILNDLLNKVTDFLPTILLIGVDRQLRGALFMGSKGYEGDEAAANICRNVVMMMEAKSEVRDIIFAAASHFMHVHHDYQERMAEALELMKKKPYPEPMGKA